VVLCRLRADGYLERCNVVCLREGVVAPLISDRHPSTNSIIRPMKEVQAAHGTSVFR